MGCVASGAAHKTTLPRQFRLAFSALCCNINRATSAADFALSAGIIRVFTAPATGAFAIKYNGIAAASAGVFIVRYESVWMATEPV